ncbi:glycosyltransferase family 4 protein [Aeromonas sp.]|uniref:glycosyltransferase family 4 protein n=1 Tax=Aeromonas sp. TaxID=647 RepID=UPI002910C3C4|nr:glycosyltransferase family 4 protein [Aeromonas sp.]MDU7579895.1 glycosyltransferase family 4 protein [Aeromonas sp.]
MSLHPIFSLTVILKKSPSRFKLKKIVLSSNTSWSIFNFRLELIKYLSKTYHIEIIAPQDQYTIKLRNMGFVVHEINMASSSIAPLKDLDTIFGYFMLLNKLKPDYYLGFTAKPNIYGGFVAGCLGCKVINNIAGLGRTFSSPSFLQNLMQLLYRFGLSKSNHVFFQNKDDLTLFKRNRLLKNVNCSVLPGSGVNIERFHCKKITVNPHENKNVNIQFTFLFSARLLIEKGIREYISAAVKLKAIYPWCLFQVLGKHDGTASELPKEELDAACNEGVIEYLGTTDDVVSVLHRTDCFVLPSFYREGVPRSLLEAGSCGLPLITTDSVGCRETVVNGINGFLVEPRNSEALFEAMKNMVEMSSDERNSMGLASRDYIVANFSESLVLEKYSHILME